MEAQFNVLLLYSKVPSNLGRFYEHIREINICQNIALLLVGFNINTLDPTSPILQTRSNYVQVATEPTQISGALLEHIFVQKNIFKKN